MPRRSPYSIELSKIEREELTARARRYTSPYRDVIRAKIVVPVQFVPNLIAAMQEHWRVFSESYSNVGWNKGTGGVH